MQDIIEKLKSIKPQLKQEFGITQIALFGSYARGEAKSDSDIDLAIMKMDRKNGFLVARAKRFIADFLQKEVDIGHIDSIRPFIKNKIIKDLIYV